MNNDERVGIGFISPAVIIITIFVFIALFYVVYMSFFNFDFKLNGEVEKTFIFLDNYKNLFADEKFWKALSNTVQFSAMVVPAQIIISLGLGFLLTRKVKATNLFRAIYFLPMITATAAISMIFMFLFSVQGPVNDILINANVLTAPIDFLHDERYALGFIAIMNIWQSVPYTTIILIAAMTDVPDVLYEAADIDGASEFRKFRKITIPGIMPALIFTIIISVVGTLQLFDQTYIISGGSGGPADSTLSLSLLIYNYAFNPTYSSMGYAAALSVILGAVIMAITAGIRYYEKRRGY